MACYHQYRSYSFTSHYHPTASNLDRVLPISCPECSSYHETILGLSFEQSFSKANIFPHNQPPLHPNSEYAKNPQSSRALNWVLSDSPTICSNSRFHCKHDARFSLLYRICHAVPPLNNLCSVDALFLIQTQAVQFASLSRVTRQFGQVGKAPSSTLDSTQRSKQPLQNVTLQEPSSCVKVGVSSWNFSIQI